jgi:hypothetical protein
MGYGGHCVLPQKGMKTGPGDEMLGEPQMMETGTVWHCEAVCECGPERFVGTEE